MLLGNKIQVYIIDHKNEIEMYNFFSFFEIERKIFYKTINISIFIFIFKFIFDNGFSFSLMKLSIKNKKIKKKETLIEYCLKFIL